MVARFIARLPCAISEAQPFLAFHQPEIVFSHDPQVVTVVAAPRREFLGRGAEAWHRRGHDAIDVHPDLACAGGAGRGLWPRRQRSDAS